MIKVYRWINKYKIELIIGISALSIRLLFYFKIKNIFLFNNPILDAKYYYEWAVRIVQGDWISIEQGVFLMSPGYSYFLAFIFKIFSQNIHYPILFQVACGSFSCILLYRITKKVVPGRLGILAPFLLAFYGIAIFYDMMLLKASLYQFLSIFMLYLFLCQLDSKNSILSLFIGLIIGCLAQLRPYAMLIVPLIIGFTWFLYRYKLKKIVQSMGLLFLGMAIFIFPVGIRNFIVGNEFVPFTAHGGMNFYTGNNQYSQGPYTPLPFARTDPEVEQQDFLAEAEKLAHKKLTHGEANRFWYYQGIEFIVQHPLAWLLLVGKKILIFFNNYEPPININYNFFRKHYTVWKYIPLLSYGLIAPLGIVGLLFFGWKTEKKLFLSLYGIIYFFSNIVFFVVSEYRYPVVPVFIVFAVIGVSMSFSLYQKKEIKKFFPVIASYIFCFWLCNFDVYGTTFGLGRYKQATLANSYFGLGYTYEKADLTDCAIDAYKKAIDIMPQFRSLVNLSRIFVERGNETEAEDFLKMAIKLKYSSFEAHNNLGGLYFKQGRTKEAYDEFKIALILRPDSKVVKNNLKKAEAILKPGTK